MSNRNILIFTDLDGSLLNHNNFDFKEIKDFILNCISRNIKLYLILVKHIQRLIYFLIN